MDESFIEFKKRLKLVKKDLEEFIGICELQLLKYGQITDKVNAIKFCKENGIRYAIANIKNIDKDLVLMHQSIKYNLFFKKIIKMVDEGKISLQFEDISFNGGNYVDDKLYFRSVRGEEAYSFLKENEELEQNDSISEMLMKYANGDLRQAIKLSELYLKFNILIMIIKEYIKDINSLITAIDNNKVKAPIKDIGILYSNLILLRMSDKDIYKIMESAITFNKKYATKNINHTIKDIELINELAKYYDGTLKQEKSLEVLLNKLKDNSLDYFRKILLINNLIWLINGMPKELIKDFYIKLPTMKYVNKCMINLFDNLNEDNIVDSISKENQLIIKNEDVEFYKYLRQFYKNGEIISIPKDKIEFYFKLDCSSLDDNEKKFIKKLLEDKLKSINTNNKLSYLSDADRNILEISTKLLDSLNKNNFDIWELKRYLEDIQIICDMLNEDLSFEDRKELLDELSRLINKLSLICDKYNKFDNKSLNKYIFLLNKDNIPYIYEDIKCLEKDKRKIVKSVISRINPSNKSNFKPIKNNKLSYQMYKYSASNIDVYFLEVDIGVYIIIGTSRVISSNDIFINRLKLNVELIKKMENLLKNINVRNDLLEEHEIYLSSIIENNCRKKVITKK